jgi:uncharacterized protein YcsI (UPF0317 family)
MTTSEATTAVTPAETRRRYREGLVAPSSGEAPGFTQANLVVVPEDWAYDLLLFAQRNPQPVPVLDVTEPGERGTALAAEADLATSPCTRPASTAGPPAGSPGRWWSR